MTHPVVVGVDTSACSLDAVELAAHEASMRALPLHVVCAYPWAYADRHGPPATSWLQRETEDAILQASDHARRVAPDVTVTSAVIDGPPSAALVRLSSSAATVVIGHRGSGGFPGLLVGSVATQVCAHAACPVLVARGRPGTAGEVVLGADGSPASDAAVGFAIEAAAMRGVPLAAIHVWSHPVSAGPGDMLPTVYDVDEVGAEESRVLAEALAGWRERYPEVVVQQRVIHGRVRPALLEATGRAQLAVVGTRGHGGFSGLLLGSVSQALLNHADCPLAVVPRRQESLPMRDQRH